MKDNTRHVPDSTRCCRTPLSRSATLTRRFPAIPKESVQNPYKSDRFREPQFSKYSVSTTYTFNALKCTDFRAALPVSTLKAQSVGAESKAARLKMPVHGGSFSLGEKVGIRGKPAPWCIRADENNKFANTVQHEITWDILSFLENSTTLSQPLTTTHASAVPFSRKLRKPVADEVTSLILKSLNEEDGWSDEYKGFECVSFVCGRPRRARKLSGTWNFAKCRILSKKGGGGCAIFDAHRRSTAFEYRSLKI